MKFVDDLEANSDFSNDELEADNNQPSTTKVTDDVVQDKIVTCTVTTGLTTQNGFNNGSLLGFTLSIPSTSLSSTPVSTLSSPNGRSSETSTDLVTNVTKEKNNDNFKALNNPPHDPSKTSTVQDVDEDYDNF